MPRRRSMPHAITRDYIELLFPFKPYPSAISRTDRTKRGLSATEPLTRVICWPPNLFALTSTLLGETDACKQTVCELPKSRTAASAGYESWPPTLGDLPKPLRQNLERHWNRIMAEPTVNPVSRLINRDTPPPAPGATIDTGSTRRLEVPLEYQWAHLVRFCGERWARHISHHADFSWIRYDEPALMELDWNDRARGPERLKRLYDVVLSAWGHFHRLGDRPSLPASSHPGSYLDSLAASVIVALWRYFLSCLESHDDKDASERGGRRDRHGIWELVEQWPEFVVVMSLHAIADEACLGWGLHKAVQIEDPRKPKLKALLRFVEALLDEQGTLALTHPQNCRVLPKRHTPSVGMTLQSVSLNLAFHRSPVDVRWHQPPTPGTLEREDRSLASMSILLLPWPLEIPATAFAEQVHGDASDMTRPSHPWRYFSYDTPVTAESLERLERYVEGAIRNAKKEAGHIHMVVFPEAALTQHELETKVEGVLRDNGVQAYVAGVRGPWRVGAKRRTEAQRAMGCTWAGKFGHNAVCCRTWTYVRGGDCYPSYGSSKKTAEALGYEPDFGPRNGFELQQKHHRWCLGRSQITQYQLGGVLAPKHTWWEGIGLGQRKVRFINLGGELTVCPLICEDLARQDPIGDLIRATGPSLVVAVLLDGPQLPQRWPGKYASVLAEDPGSAVITLTALGMVSRYRSEHGKGSRAIALWSDGLSAPRAIELEGKADAVLLSVAVESKEEKAADGRRDGLATNTVVLGGIHQICSSDK